MAVRGWHSARTSLRELGDESGGGRFTAAVSLHAHTHHSRESLADIPRYIARIPLIGKGLERDISRADASDDALAFSEGWWHPPVGPRAVFESEADQIETRLDLWSIASVTDHDDIAAGLELQTLFAHRRAPISFEWTVPHER